MAEQADPTETGPTPTASPHADPAHEVADRAALDALYDAPGRRALTKEAGHLTSAYRRFVEAAPCLVIASAGSQGLDLSPRGDPGQAAFVLDARTLAIPDRRGANRIDTLRNLLDDPRIGLIFLIPGTGEALRIRGRARLSVDPDRRARFAMEDRPPTLVTLVAIERVCFQCARAVMRAQLWSPEAWPDPETLPTVGRMNANPDPDFDVEAYDQGLRERQLGSLW
ncbi:MAG: MSMEG_1061 family FMN-dependent PPOX-type flavoprotein [Pseudomonadota bacterium]